jgi:hypothetical protein
METVNLGPVIVAGSFPNSSWDVGTTYTQDLNGDGIDEILFVGGVSIGPNTSLHIFGWQAGHLQNITNQWFPNESNHAEGVGAVVYGDFNGDHKIDALLTAYNNMGSALRTYALMNQGDHFNKVDLGLAALQHGATVYDINHDGYTDAITTGWGYSNGSTTVYMGSAAGLTPYTISAQSRYSTGGAGIALGDFLGNGTTTAVITNHQTSSVHTAADTVLMKITLNESKHTFDLTPISTLPIPILENNTLNPLGESLDIRAESIDFNHDGLLDVMVFSRADFNGTSWPDLSAVQFLKNLGSGKFEDSTSMMLSGYKNNTNTTYNPEFGDFNNDGLLDMFLSGRNTPNSSFFHDSTTLLLQQPDGSFLDTGRNTLSAAVNSVVGLATLAHGPNGKTFLVTEVVPFSGGSVTVSAQEMTVSTVSTNRYIIDGTWMGTIPTVEDWITLGAGDRDIIRSHITMPEALALANQFTPEQRAALSAENAVWMAQGHIMHDVGSAIPPVVIDYTQQTHLEILPTNCNWA